MTPQEALAQAVRGCCVMAATPEHAQHILDALPKGWGFGPIADPFSPLIIEPYKNGLRDGTQQERQRLRALAWAPYSAKGGDGIQYGQCLVCGDDGLSEADVDAFFAEPSKEATA